MRKEIDPNQYQNYTLQIMELGRVWGLWNARSWDWGINNSVNKVLALHEFNPQNLHEES